MPNALGVTLWSRSTTASSNPPQTAQLVSARSASATAPQSIQRTRAVIAPAPRRPPPPAASVIAAGAVRIALMMSHPFPCRLPARSGAGASETEDTTRHRLPPRERQCGECTKGCWQTISWCRGGESPSTSRLASPCHLLYSTPPADLRLGGQPDGAADASRQPAASNTAASNTSASEPGRSSLTIWTSAICGLRVLQSRDRIRSHRRALAPIPWRPAEIHDVATPSRPRTISQPAMKRVHPPYRSNV